MPRYRIVDSQGRTWPFEAAADPAALRDAILATLAKAKREITYRRTLPGYPGEHQWVRRALAVEEHAGDAWRVLGVIPTERWPVGGAPPNSPGRSRVAGWLSDPA